MPSSFHEALLILFRNQPHLTPTLLRSAFGITIPAYTHVRVEPPDFSKLEAAAPYHADLVLSFQHVEDPTPVAAVVVEAQLVCDPHKRRSWPAQVFQLYQRLGCRVALLVIAPDPKVAAWCATPLEGMMGRGEDGEL